MNRKFCLLMIILSIFLVGCDKVYLNSIETKPIEFSTQLAGSPLAVNDKGVYFVEDNFLYYMGWHNLKTAKLTGMAFADDKEVEDPYAFSFKRYSETLGEGDLILYGDHLYGIFYLNKSDGSNKQTLNRMNLKGEKMERLITFEDFTTRFRIDSGNVYAYSIDEVKQKEYIQIYNNKLEKIDRLEYNLSSNENVYGFYLDKGELVIPKAIFSPDKPSNILYDNGNKKLSYEFISSLDKIDFNSDEILMKGIFENRDDVFEFDNKLITFATEDFFYTSNVADAQVYQQYNLDGTLNNSIKPSYHIDSIGDIDTGFFKSDFNYIERIYNDRYVFASTFGKFYMCDLELESCRYLNE